METGPQNSVGGNYTSIRPCLHECTSGHSLTLTLGCYFVLWWCTGSKVVVALMNICMRPPDKNLDENCLYREAVVVCCLDAVVVGLATVLHGCRLGWRVDGSGWEGSRKRSCSCACVHHGMEPSDGVEVRWVDIADGCLPAVGDVQKVHIL